MTVYEAINRIEELDKMREWIEYAKTNEDVTLQTNHNFHPNDAAFRKLFLELVIRERSRIENLHVEEE